jgi:hypothetical protein
MRHDNDVELGRIADLRRLIGNPHPATVYRMIRRGELPPPIKFGGTSLWDLTKVREMIVSRLQEARK